MTSDPTSGGGLRIVAIGFAGVAVVLAGIATVVTLSRGDAKDTKVAPPPEPTNAIPDGKHVAATDIVRLKRDVVAAVLEHGDSVGLQVTDPDLRDKLGLSTDDVLTALSGRPLKKEWDVLDAVSGTVMLDAKAIYVELRHGGKPILARWEIDGDLKAARRGAVDMPTKLPSVAPVADPIVATITRIDETTFEMPEATRDRIAADPGTYTKGVRGYASFGGKEGMRIFNIRPGSVLEAFGIRNSDVVSAVNTETVTSVDQLDTRLAALDSADTWTFQVERMGRAMTITVTTK